MKGFRFLKRREIHAKGRKKDDHTHGASILGECSRASLKKNYFLHHYLSDFGINKLRNAGFGHQQLMFQGS